MAELASMDNYLINWSADSNDWQAKGRDDVLIGAIPGSKPGAIVLMHSAGELGRACSRPSTRCRISSTPYGYKGISLSL